MTKGLKIFLTGICMLTVSTAAWAGSGAFRLEVPDAGAMGKGGAFAGEANTPAAVYYNPAGMVQMDDALTANLSVVAPKAVAKPNAAPEEKMQWDNFYIPSMFYVTDLGLEKFTFGVGATSSWGLTTQWAQDSFARYNATNTRLINKDYLITGAYQVSEQFSIGLGLNIDDSLVEKEKKLAQTGGADGDFKLIGKDNDVGYVISGLYKFNDRHSVGLVYRSAIEQKYQGKIYLDNLNGAGLNYQAIFGGTSYSTDVVSKATLPQSIVLGYSFKPTDKWTFNADLEWMDWSVLEEELLAYPSETDATRLAILNNGNPGPRDYESVWSFGLGTEYDVSDILRVRGGYFYHNSPVNDAHFQACLPDSESHSVTLGLGYDLTKSLTADFAYSSMFFEDRDIDNAEASGTINATYKQRIDLFLASLTYKF